MKNSLLYRISLVVVPAFYKLAAALLFRTYRTTHYGLEYWQECKNPGPYIAAIWHYSIYYILSHTTSETCVAMVSASKDGEYVARLLESRGSVAVRGSRGTGKRGVAALKEMISWVCRGKTGVIVADGSQGPARVAQAGAVLLASKSGAPILPVVWAADRYYSFRSWDRSIVPKPFARVAVHTGKPIRVPAKLEHGGLEKYRIELEERLNELYDQAWAGFGRKGH